MVKSVTRLISFLFYLNFAFSPLLEGHCIGVSLGVIEGSLGVSGGDCIFVIIVFSVTSKSLRACSIRTFE